MLRNDSTVISYPLLNLCVYDKCKKLQMLCNTMNIQFPKYHTHKLSVPFFFKAIDVG